MKRVVVVVLVVLLLMPAACVGWFIVEAHNRVAHKREVAARELPRVRALFDARIGNLLDGPLFARPEGDDAGELLNLRLDFPSHVAEQTVRPAHCNETLKAYVGKENELPVEQLDGCDTTILTELRRYGRWSQTPGPRAALPAGPRADDALPNFVALQSLAKIHLLKGHANGHFAEAAAEVRHLARLLFTNEYLLTSMLGIAVINITHKLAQTLGEADEISETKEQLMDLRLRLFTATFSINRLVPPQLAESAPGTPRFVRCVVLTEQTFMSATTTLPTDADCSFENARFELAHPWKQNERAHLELLSLPAQLGGRVARALFASQLTELEEQLAAAEELPADDAWETAQSEYMSLLLRR